MTDLRNYVLRVAGYNGSGPDPTGLYVVGCDVDAYDGMGQAELTGDEDAARGFESPAEAMAYWRRQSTVKPVRDDGKPNRPLTAYTIEVFARPT